MRFATRLLRQDGMTLIELLIAVPVCAVGIMATVGVMDASRNVATSSEQREAAAHHAERALEELLSRPYAEIAHATGATFATSAVAGHPASYVSGGQYAYDWRDAANP